MGAKGKGNLMNNSECLKQYVRMLLASIPRVRLDVYQVPKVSNNGLKEKKISCSIVVP